MKKKKTSLLPVILAFVVLLLIVVGFFAYTFLTRIKDNPRGTVGNTPGNLYNNGIFCENDGMIYFVNSYDNDAIYCMKPDETNIKKLYSTNASFLNAAGKYLYYYKCNEKKDGGLGDILGATGIFRTLKSGSDNPICLHKTDGETLVLIDSYLYYQTYDKKDHLSLYKTKIDGSNQTKLSDDSINPVNASNSSFLYNTTTKSFHLHEFNTRSDTSTEIFKTDVYMPITHGNDIYYISIHDHYNLYKFNKATGEVTPIVEERIDRFNMNDQYIYYQTAEDDYHLKICNLDGSNSREIASGSYTDICLTSKHLYFRDFNNKTPMYHANLDGTGFGTFSAAYDAYSQSLSK